MKVTRSSKTTLKLVNKNKIQTLHKVMDEYSRVCNTFIKMFWGNEFKPNDLKKEITSIPDTWLSARMRQDCAREALSSCGAAVEQAKEAGIEPVMPTHYGKRMILSSKIVSIEEGKGSFDLIVKLTAIGDKIKIILPLKSHYHMNQFKDWKRSNSITVLRDAIQFSYKKGFDKKTGKKVIGVDIGINKLLVTSDAKQYGTRTKELIAKIRKKAVQIKSVLQS